MAGRFLQEKGYRLLDANYRCRWGEVDIVAQEGDELVFVEVRTRRGTQYGTPEESVTAAKSATVNRHRPGLPAAARPRGF